jgi:modulator of FtsH protease
MSTRREYDEDLSSYARGQLSEPRVDDREVYNPTFRASNAHLSDPERTQAIQETYRLLAVAVVCAMAAGWLGSRTPAVIEFFFSPLGWIVAMLGLNGIPAIARNTAKKNPRMGIVVLASMGFLSGLVLSPLLFLGMVKSGLGTDAPNLVDSALVITAFVFLGISGFVYKRGTAFTFGSGLMAGAFWALVGAIVVNMWFLSGVLSMIIMAGIGILGAAQLAYATSQILNNPQFRDPMLGALALFAGLFNLFQAILSILISSNRR